MPLPDSESTCFLRIRVKDLPLCDGRVKRQTYEQNVHNEKSRKKTTFGFRVHALLGESEMPLFDSFAHMFAV